MLYNAEKNNYFYYDKEYFYETYRGSIYKKKLVKYGELDVEIENNNIYYNVVSIQKKSNNIVLLIYREKFVVNYQNLIYLSKEGYFIVDNTCFDQYLNIIPMQNQDELIELEYVYLINDKYEDIRGYKYFSKYEIYTSKKKLIYDGAKLTVDHRIYIEINPWFSSDERIKIIVSILKELPMVLIEKLLKEFNFQN